MRWPKGPPHLALNPTYFFLFPFLSLPLIISNRKTLFSPLKRAFFCLFSSVSLCFSLAFFWPPPFSFSVSRSLSLSLVLLFLPSCLSCLLSFGSLFYLFLSLSSWLLFHEKNNIKLWYYKVVFFINPFSVSCLVFSFRSLFLIFVFSWFQVVFLFQHECS